MVLMDGRGRKRRRRDLETEPPLRRFAQELPPMPPCPLPLALITSPPSFGRATVETVTPSPGRGLLGCGQQERKGRLAREQGRATLAGS